MTAKQKKTKSRRGRLRPAKVGDLRASVEDDLLLLADGTEPDLQWNRPRKRMISLRMDIEVLEWFRAKGPGYQTRINRILRRVMEEGKKREG